MYTFELSNGFKGDSIEYSKQEILFDIALIMRYELIRFDDDDRTEEEFINSIPDIYIYKDGELDEIIKGADLYEC